MSDQPEPLVAILAEMRLDADILVFPTFTPDKLRTYADRIEAAYKREHAEWHAETEAAKEDRNRVACRMRREFAEKCRACKAAPGNAAALREALTAFVDSIQWLCDGDERGIFKKQFAPLLSDARAALAAPARNCDKYGMDDIKGMDADFGAFCQQYGAKDGENCVGCPIKHMDNLCCHAAWMLLAAEGGAE